MEFFCAVLLGVLSVDAPPILNSGFEQFSEQTDFPFGWQQLPQGWHFTHLPNGASLVRYETKPLQDSRALLITVASDHPDKTVAYNVWQDVPGFIAGKTYRVSANVQTRGLRHLPLVCVQCLDASGTKFLGFARSSERAIEGDVEQWERVETKITVPEGTATFRLRIGIPSEGNAGGTALIDDVEIVAIAE